MTWEKLSTIFFSEGYCEPFGYCATSKLRDHLNFNAVPIGNFIPGRRRKYIEKYYKDNMSTSYMVLLSGRKVEHERYPLINTYLN